MMGNGNNELSRKPLSLITHHSSLITLSFLTLSCLVLASCKREERGFRVQPPSSGRVNTIRLTELQPGPAQPPDVTKNEYEENAYAVSEGKRLYQQMNCVGCHFHGGGGIGPPLMDARWIYGSDPAQIFSTIVQGRPNGMPAFRGKLNDDQVWKLCAYVRSLSGQVAKDVAPGRDDDMSGPPAESSTEKKPPEASSGIPKSAEMPK
jgi:cytochrome c oxidase cbb3-type subunit 3